MGYQLMDDCGAEIGTFECMRAKMNVVVENENGELEVGDIDFEKFPNDGGIDHCPLENAKFATIGRVLTVEDFELCPVNCSYAELPE